MCGFVCSVVLLLLFFKHSRIFQMDRWHKEKCEGIWKRDIRRQTFGGFVKKKQNAHTGNRNLKVLDVAGKGNTLGIPANGLFH